MTTSIVWFKNDLRLHDNETLIRAIKESDSVIPVYCIDEHFFEINEFGMRKMGIYKLKFLLESLIDLDASLKLLGSSLFVIKGKPEVEIFNIAKAYNVKKVYAKKEVAPEEIQTQLKLENELWKINCTIDVFSTSTLYHPEDLPFSIKDIPDLFTKFRTKIEKETSIRAIFKKPLHISSPNLPVCDIYSFFDKNIRNLKIHYRSAFPFKGGETEALKRLNYYLFDSHLILKYKETRNDLIGADYSSKLSAWLALGCISSKYIYHQIANYEKAYTANNSTYWLYFELVWRDFFRFMVKKHKQKLYTIGGLLNKLDVSKNMNFELFDKWKNGNTGVAFIDANMIELNTTGFMSNRGRQNVASYFCNDLKLDWRYGAAYFEQQLVDYDECSNWGNWAYIAGVGNDARKNRYFSIEKQLQHYDPNKEFVNLWLNTNTKDEQ